MRSVTVLFAAILVTTGPLAPAQAPWSPGVRPQLTTAEIREVKAKIGAGLKDPYSAVYTFDLASEPQPRSSLPTIVCGTVNAKNSYGGYVGTRRFWILLNGRGAALRLSDPKISDSAADDPANLAECESQLLTFTVPGTRRGQLAKLAALESHVESLKIASQGDPTLPQFAAFDSAGRLWVAEYRKARVYYLKTCSGGLNIPARKRIYFVDEDAARASGYTRSSVPGC